ncbi:MAG: mechanosensitive ion channel family protein [Acidobacteriota bacterium]
MDQATLERLAEDWLPFITRGAIMVLAMEVVFLALRKLKVGGRIGILHHLWAISLGVFITLSLKGVPSEELSWKIVVSLASVLSALVLYAMLDRLIFARPWDRGGPGMMPGLVVDVLRVVLVAGVTLLMATTVFKAHLSSILVSSTVLSAVVGFALQDLLRNVFAGMALQMESPFEIGDWVDIDGTPAEITEMTWRSTRLRTNEGVIINEPNALVAATRLTSYGSGEEAVAFPIKMNLPRDLPPSVVKEALLEAAEHAPSCLSTPAPQAFLEEFGQFANLYHLRAWTRRVDGIRVFYDEMQVHVWHSLQRHGLPVAVPLTRLEFSDVRAASRASAKEDLERRRTLLEQVELFEELGDAGFDRLAQAARRKHFTQGERLVTQGAEGQSLFVIESGRVKVFKTEGPRIAVLGELERGAVFGEMSLLTGEPRSATVEASSDSAVLAIDKDDFAPLLIDDQKLAWKLSRALALRAADARERLAGAREQHAAQSLEDSQAGLLERMRSFFGIT